MKLAVIWLGAPCGLVEVAEVSQVLAVSIFRASVNFYQTTRRSNPNDSHLLINLSDLCAEYFNGAVQKNNKKK
jgi:hypothetical protein